LEDPGLLLLLLLLLERGSIRAGVRLRHLRWVVHLGRRRLLWVERLLESHRLLLLLLLLQLLLLLLKLPVWHLRHL